MSIIQAPWKYVSPSGVPNYYRGSNQPTAVVLHIMVGYVATALEWAEAGHNGASWHYTVARDGTVYQHLQHSDGGWQAGITATAPKPTWPLWRGNGVNVNNYTLGIEHEGFPGEPFTALQAEASRELCRSLAKELGIPLDHDHFPAHAEIDVVNRVNDFNTPELRAAHYAYLFEEEDMGMTAEEAKRLATAEEQVYQLTQLVFGAPGKTADYDKTDYAQLKAQVANLTAPNLAQLYTDFAAILKNAAGAATQAGQVRAPK